ncbi:hypothetical protein ACP3VS_14245 [Lysinibacillus sp. VIII_CA]
MKTCSCTTVNLQVPNPPAPSAVLNDTKGMKPGEVVSGGSCAGFFKRFLWLEKRFHVMYGTK